MTRIIDVLRRAIRNSDQIAQNSDRIAQNSDRTTQNSDRIAQNSDQIVQVMERLDAVIQGIDNQSKQLAAIIDSQARQLGTLANRLGELIELQKAQLVMQRDQAEAADNLAQSIRTIESRSRQHPEA